MKIITVLETLIEYGREEYHAKKRYEANPTEENKKIFEEAKKTHAEYKQLTIEADEIISLKGSFNPQLY